MSKERAFVVGALLNHAFVQLLIRRVCTLNLGDSSSEWTYERVQHRIPAGGLFVISAVPTSSSTTSSVDRYGSPTEMDFD